MLKDKCNKKVKDPGIFFTCTVKPTIYPQTCSTGDARLTNLHFIETKVLEQIM